MIRPTPMCTRMSVTDSQPLQRGNTSGNLSGNTMPYITVYRPKPYTAPVMTLLRSSAGLVLVIHTNTLTITSMMP